MLFSMERRSCLHTETMHFNHFFVVILMHNKVIKRVEIARSTAKSPSEPFTVKVYVLSTVIRKIKRQSSSDQIDSMDQESAILMYIKDSSEITFLDFTLDLGNSMLFAQ